MSKIKLEFKNNNGEVLAGLLETPAANADITAAKANAKELSQNDPCHSEGGKRLRNLNSRHIKPYPSASQLHHRQ